MLELILQLQEKAPWVYQVVFYIGLARLVMKPLMTFLHEIALITPTPKDNEFLEKMMNNSVYKGFAWLLDYVSSIKLPKPEKK